MIGHVNRKQMQLFFKPPPVLSAMFWIPTSISYELCKSFSQNASVIETDLKFSQAIFMLQLIK